ncbi:MAG: FtsX-like permease family protein, partial [Bacteroidota bacterium]
LVLLLASINFITITLAKSLGRTREIGVRKSVGAIKSQLVFQFLMESVVLAFISLGFGLIIVWFVLPMFNELAQKGLTYDLSLLSISIYVSLTLFVALLAGFYPALVLSGFKPTKILKGDLTVGSGRQSLRLVMVGAQFVVTIFLITSTLIMRKQLEYMQNRNLGYDKEHLIMLPLSVPGNMGMLQQLTDGMDKGTRLKLMLEQVPEITDVSITSHDFGPGSWANLGYTDEDQTEHHFFYNTVDPNYLKTLNIDLLLGRDFELGNEADRRRSILVNEAFVKAFSLENPIGERIPNERFDDHEIIGVVKDFNFASLHMPVDPLVLSVNPAIGFSGATNVNVNSDPTTKLVVRVKPGNMEKMLPLIEDKFNEAYPGDPFDYNFVDQQLETQYEAEQNLGKIVTSATVLAIIIGALGLFALAMLTMNARFKEMSIRKVLGASSANVSLILSKSYFILVLVALIISIPLSYQVMSSWLNEFAYRSDIGISIYIMAGFISILVAWIAISYHSIKLALNNPVNGLRTE